MTDQPNPPGPTPSVSPLPPELQAANASKDDRTWGMVAHLAALGGIILPFGSIIGPLIVWIAKKDQSPFVAYHAKQAMWFQIFTVIIVVALVILGFVTCVTFPLGALAGVGSLAYAVYGAIRVNDGKDFEYYWVGEWVRKSA